jgi:hypothetical protein
MQRTVSQPDRYMAGTIITQRAQTANRVRRVTFCTYETVTAEVGEVCQLASDTKHCHATGIMEHKEHEKPLFSVPRVFVGRRSNVCHS